MATNRVSNSHRFFNNSACRYFPCHPTKNPDSFNCLFCYCPLYSFDEKCGGDYYYSGKIKACDKCEAPHAPDYYDVIIRKLEDAVLEKIL